MKVNIIASIKHWSILSAPHNIPFQIKDRQTKALGAEADATSASLNGEEEVASA